MLTRSRYATYVDSMEEPTEAISAAGGRDPAMGLRAVAALRELVERLEALQVRNARDQGWTWQEVANQLGVSRQAVHRKHTHRRGLLSREE